MKTVLIETPATDGQTEWGVSFGGANPLPSEYVACRTKDDAARLSEKMDRMLSTLAARVECIVYEECQHTWTQGRKGERGSWCTACGVTCG